MPAYGLWTRHVRRLTLQRVRFTTTGPDPRPMLLAGRTPTSLHSMKRSHFARCRPGLAAAHAKEPVRTYRNPILYADYSDPDVIRVGDAYYMVASTFHFSPGLPVLRSQGPGPLDDPGPRAAAAALRPEVRPAGPPFTLDGPAVDARDGPSLRARRVGAVDPPPRRPLLHLLRDARRGHLHGDREPPGRALERAGRRDRRARLEDPCPFWDDDGQAYLVHCKVGAGPLILHRMSAGRQVGARRRQVIVEDPGQPAHARRAQALQAQRLVLHLRADRRGRDSGRRRCCARAASAGPTNHARCWARQDGVEGPHQGGWVETPSGQGWFLHFNSTGAYGRIVHLQPVCWKDDWPVIGEPIPAQARRSAGRRAVRHARYGGARRPDRLQDSDEFAAPDARPAMVVEPQSGRRALEPARGPATCASRPTQARYLVGRATSSRRSCRGPRPRSRRGWN